MADGLTIMLWNARSILCNLGEFQKRIEETQPAIICLVETWLNDRKKFSCKGYNIFRNDRDERGGGIAILTKVELVTDPLHMTRYQNGNFEYLGIKTKFNNDALNIITLYNPHGAFNPEELEHYSSLINGKIILCGDFNAKYRSWDTTGSNAAGVNLNNFISESQNLSLLTPRDLGTRYNPNGNEVSTLDLFIGNSNLLPICQVTRCPDTGTSDHYPTCLHLRGLTTWNPICFRGKWKLDKTQWTTWINKLLNIEFNITDNSERNLKFLIDTLTEISSKSFKRTKGIYSVKYSAPWWSEECSLARARRRRAKRILRRHYSIQNLCDYKKAMAISKRVIKHTKKKYWQDFCSQLSVHTPLNKVWKVFNKIKGRSPPDTFPLEAQITLSTEDKANLMADHYSTFFGSKTDLDNEDQLMEEVSTAIINEVPNELGTDFIMNELQTVLSSLPNQKACGVDDIPYEFLKNMPFNAKSFLLEITRQCLQHGIFPETQKWRLILPFLKTRKGSIQSN